MVAGLTAVLQTQLTRHGKTVLCTSVRQLKNRECSTLRSVARVHLALMGQLGPVRAAKPVTKADRSDRANKVFFGSRGMLCRPVLP